MISAIDLIFLMALAALTVYWLNLLRKQELGATHIFVGLLLFFHGPALIFYRDVWSQAFKFGLLNDLENSTVATERAMLAVSGAFIIVGLTKILLNTILPIRRQLIFNPAFVATRQIRFIKLLTVASIVAVVLSLFIQYAFVSSPQKIIEYYFLEMPDYERGMIRREGNLGSYFFGVLIESLIPFVSFVVFTTALANKRKRSDLIGLAFMAIILVLLAKLSRFTKAGPTLYLLQVYLCYSLCKRNTFLVTTKDITFVAVSIAAIFLMVVSLGGGGDLIVAFDRLLMIPNEAIFEYFAAIPESYPFGYGRGISYVQAITGDAIGSSTPLPVSMHVAAVTRGYTDTVVNGIYILDAWAEFGWVGVISFSIVTGALLHWLDRTIAAIKSNEIRVALMAYMLNGIYTLATSSVTSALVTGGLLFVPVLALKIDKLGRRPLNEDHHKIA